MISDSYRALCCISKVDFYDSISRSTEGGPRSKARLWTTWNSRNQDVSKRSFFFFFFSISRETICQVELGWRSVKSVLSWIIEIAAGFCVPNTIQHVGKTILSTFFHFHCRHKHNKRIVWKSLPSACKNMSWQDHSWSSMVPKTVFCDFCSKIWSNLSI